MSSLPGYRQLDQETLDLHYWALTQAFPVVERVDDFPQGKQTGWCLSMESNGVMTERGNQYDIYLPYQFSYPDKDPVAILLPQPISRPDGQVPPHVYRLTVPGSEESIYAVCVHDMSFDAERYTPIVGFTNALCWILQYEDWWQDGRPFPDTVPADIQQRVQELIAAMNPVFYAEGSV